MFMMELDTNVTFVFVHLLQKDISRNTSIQCTFKRSIHALCVTIIHQKKLCHVKSVPEKNDYIACTECNKSIKSKSSFLSRHIKLFHSEDKKIHVCKLCPFQTVHDGSLTKHVRNIHKLTK